jgi:hypothetical protein
MRILLKYEHKCLGVSVRVLTEQFQRYIPAGANDVSMKFRNTYLWILDTAKQTAELRIRKN